MTPNTKRTLRLALIGLAVVFLASEVYAAAPAGWLDRTADQYKTITALWQDTMLKYANRLFWLLAVIELTYIGIKLALKGAEMQEFTGELVHFIMVTGFFAALLQFGTTWIPWVIESFQQIATEANAAAGGGPSSSPSTIIDSIFKAALHAITTCSWRQIIVAGTFGLSILICGIVIACIMVLAYIEMYVVCSAGLIFYGFGGSRWTRGYATKIITYAVSVGVKLMLIQLIVGIGGSLLGQLTAPVSAKDFDINNTASLLIAVSCVAYLVKAIPQTVQSIINGVDVNTHGFLGQAAGVTKAAVVTGAAIATGGTAAVAGAAKLAAAQGAASAASTAAGAGGSAGSMLASSAGSAGAKAAAGGASSAAGSAANGTSIASTSAARSGASSGGGSAGGGSVTSASLGSAGDSSSGGGSSGGGSSSGGSAGSSATSATAASSGMGLGGRAKAGAQFGARMAGNLFKAAAQDIGKQLSGERSAAHGVMGFRMQKAMSGEADALKASTSDTAAASGTTPGASLAKTAGKAVDQATSAATSSNQPQQQPTTPDSSANDQPNQGQA